MVNNVVAHFIDTGVPGGAEKLMMDLCVYCLAEQIKPVIFHFNHPWIKSACDSLSIQECSLGEKGYYRRTLTLPLFAKEFSSFLKKHSVSLLHSHLFGPIVAGALAAHVTRIPHLATLHDTHVIEDRPARRHLLKVADGLGTHFIAVGEHVRRFYLSTGSLRETRVRTIYNGVTIPALQDGLSGRVRAGLGIPSDAIVFACVGRIVALKRVDAIIRAFTQVCNERNSYLLVVGDGPERAACENSTSPELADRIFFLGQRNDVSDILTATDVFVQFSTTEGLSLSILEAMAHGVACVVSDVGGNAELIVPDDCGVLVGKDDFYLLARRLQQLLVDDGFRRRIGYRARKRTVEQFGLNQCMRSYVDVYATFLDLL
jgi:glycosyltransferase involved in cell wall biosynthesis